MTDDTIDDMNSEDGVDDERLRALLARVAELPQSIEPPADAWAGIRNAIHAPVTTSGLAKPFISNVQAASARSPSAFWQQPRFLAAAAALLVVASSAVTATLMGERSSDAAATVAAGAPDGRPRSTGQATLAEFTVVENDYIRMASQLSSALQSGDSQLAPETIAKLNESLRVIDAAILEARRALADDPANSAIVELLSGSYEQKLDLLRRTTEMARS